MNPKRLGFQATDVHFGAFDFTLHVIVGPHTNVLKYVRWKLDDPEISADVSRKRGMQFERSGWAPVIWLPRRPRTPREYGCLAHEVLHTVRQMLVDWASMPLTRDSDEAFCHATGYAVTTILERIK